MNNQEKFNQYNLEQAEGEAATLRELVEHGYARDYDEAEKQVELMDEAVASVESLNKHDYDSNEERVELVERAFRDVKEMFGAQGAPMEPLQEFWPKVRGQGLLVRNEDPTLAIKKIAAGEGIEFHPQIEEGGLEHANAAVDNDDGLHIAFEEGLRGGEINCVYGFKPEGLKVNHIKKPEGAVRDPRRLAYSRSVSGVLPIENIRYLIVRIPKKFFPEDELAEREREQIESEKPPTYILRAIDLTKRTRHEEEL